jgi:chemosensory pili system protein ChpA (sensor histidine kinase/response regulator)
MTTELADVIFRVVDVVKLLMKRDSQTLDRTRREFANVMRRLDQVKRAEVAGLSCAMPSEQALPAEDATESRLRDTRPLDIQETEHRTDVDRRKEPEAKMAEESGVIRVSRDRLERLLNLVGELMISGGRLEQRLLTLEHLSDQVLAFKSRMLDSVRTFEEKHAFTLPEASPNLELSNVSEPHNLVDFGSLEFDRYDDFNILARRMAEVSADVGEAMSQLSASVRKSREDMSQLQQLTLSMRDEIARARMVPIGTPFTRFRRAVREMAKSTGKNVALVVSGEHTEVDTGVVERLVDPLIHLVRNAVYHGIEPERVRVACGKPPAGTVYLHAAHRGNAVIIEVEDDGGGIDTNKVKAKAVALGLLRPQLVPTMPDAEAIKLIFLPGFSTAEEVGNQAGRGMGMDVVKRSVEAINGLIEVETELGVGTKFTLRLPQTLLISMALSVRVGKEQYALPLQSIREVILPSIGALQDVGGRPMLQAEDEMIEIRSLAQLLGVESTSPAGPTPIVIVRTATGVVGVSVDELLGRQEIVIKSLGTLRPFLESCFVGANIDPEGHVILVLDVGRLDEVIASTPHADSSVEKHIGEEGLGASSPISPVGSKILLIDDSLSIRKFVGKMLEGAGYRVDTAVDGEEGLRKGSDDSYQLIITDLEMPKLNGYEVIQAFRDRPQTKSIPIVVMTTRAGEKHRQMALRIGASGYIAKPVEERALIVEVGKWIGQATCVKN